jgi:hypothetical protein
MKFRAEDSILQTHYLQSGDFVLISTDGLFDNLYEDEIALIIFEHLNTKLIENHQKLFVLSNDNHGILDNFMQIEDSNKNFIDDINRIKIKAFESNFDKISLNKNIVKEKITFQDELLNGRLIKFEINNEILQSTCDFLIEKAYKGILNIFFF